MGDVTISCEVLVVIVRVSTINLNYCKAPIAKLWSCGTVQVAFA